VEPYEIVLMDWKMPGMDGIETTRAIHHDRNLTHVPTVIMVSAYGREEAHASARGVNLAGFLTKPVTPSTLLDAIMQAMGREVDEESRSGRRQEEAAADIARLRGAKILLVEDNEVNQELALELLSSNGLSVEVANDGQEALDILDKEKFDGVLMDCQMPIMDGYTATRRLRQHTRFRELPILAMTANAMAGDREKVLDAGMNDHIAKPINVNEMFRTMAKWITPSHPEAMVVEETPQAEVDIPELDGIDTAAGLERTQNNGKLYLKLLRKAGKNQANFIEEYDAAVEAADWELAQRLAHSLKGVAGTIGAEGLHTACKELESFAKEQKSDEKSREAVRLELERVLASIATFEESKEASLAGPVNSEALAAVLETLSQQLSDYDTGAQDTLEANHQMLANGELASLTISLERALESYDFEAAQHVVVDMRATMTTGATERCEVDRERIMQVVEQLASLIDEYDTSAMDVIELEEEFLAAAGLSDDIGALREALEEYDFEAASAVLVRMVTAHGTDE
jgi:CheY-like chemotaxis protein